MKSKQTIFVGKNFPWVNMKINFKKGFTIAEIVVVVGIMALLTTLVYTSLDGSKKQSRDQKRVADISAVQLSLEQFYARNKYYPNSLSGLATYLPQIPVGISYVPLASINADVTECASYHLYVTLESKISALDSKKGFDSSGKIKCGSATDTGALVNASSSPLIYDVTP